MKKLGRILLRIAAGAGILLAASAIAGFLVIRSGWFREEVRERIIAGIERSTGARAEIGGFDFDWERLTATVSLLVVHGREPAGETPLLTAQSVTAGFRVISILERKVDLSSLRVIRPVVRIVFFPDGSNNIPPPRDRGAWTEDLLNLAVRRYQIDDGIVEYDNQKIPLNVRGEDLRAAMTYERAGPRYRGEFRSRRARVMAAGLPPLEIDATAAFVLEKSQIEFSRIHFATGDSRADLSGILTDVRAPRGTFAVKADDQSEGRRSNAWRAFDACRDRRFRRTIVDRAGTAVRIRDGRPDERARARVHQRPAEHYRRADAGECANGGGRAWPRRYRRECAGSDDSRVR